MGIKPDSGGSPPRDSIKIRMMEVIRGNLFHMWDKDRVVVDEFNVNSIKVDSVIRIYRARFRIIIVGL